ncbi:hypothetical protein FACS1894180_1260 [Bacteroidia bacterium]|nr:hypothetical protein FACS1894180_1260 [Bacteroidia bacterium]
MPTEKLLDQCLAILQKIKDNKKSLKTLLEFMQQEFCNTEQDNSAMVIPDYKAQIPEKYRALVKDIAENMEMGFISYVNLDTLEVEGIPADQEFQDEEWKISEPEWDNQLEIKPLDSHDSYQIMEIFVNNLPVCKEKNRLCDAISGHKPFANFNRIIHDSDYREKWFEFRTKSLEKYVIDNYLDEIINKK